MQTQFSKQVVLAKTTRGAAWVILAWSLSWTLGKLLVQGCAWHERAGLLTVGLPETRACLLRWEKKRSLGGL